MVNQSHQFLQSVLGLETLLLGLSVLVTLFLENLLLVLVAILSLIETDLNRDQVLLHAVNHVLIAALYHHLVLVSVLDPVKSLSRVAQTIGFTENRVFDRILLRLRLLKLSFFCLELFVLGKDSFVNVVILLPDAS